MKAQKKKEKKMEFSKVENSMIVTLSMVGEQHNSNVHKERRRRREMEDRDNFKSRNRQKNKIRKVSLP